MPWLWYIEYANNVVIDTFSAVLLLCRALVLRQRSPAGHPLG
ncbi:hypothetical protein [Streptomyces sp. NRRL_B-2557]|nr:hypothetical protein [Streptomyces sp. NRRL_B-2557]MDX2748295.1 hypothetical protein [Streptomyces sp. NRRL_B-2557]